MKVCARRGCDAERASDKYCRACKRQRNLNDRYGIDAAEYDRMYSEQGGRCWICQNVRRLMVDHDHATGTVRALLCATCNRVIGMFHEDRLRLRRAAEYLDAHQ